MELLVPEKISVISKAQFVVHRTSHCVQNLISLRAISIDEPARKTAFFDFIRPSEQSD